MKRWSCLILVLAAFLNAGPTVAEWVRVTGSAFIHNGDLAKAREAAREDAMRQASMQNGAEINSRDRVEMGLLTESTIDIRSEAIVKDLIVQSEQIKEGIIKLVADVDVVSSAQCEPAMTNHYLKHVGMLGFVMQDRKQADIGGLYDVERELSATLTQYLSQSDSVLPRAASQIQLYRDVLNAPTRETQQRTLSNAVNEARELGVQFVVSGIVRNIALQDDRSLHSSLFSRSLRALDITRPQRHFVVDLFIHDGFSGAILFDKRYAAIGLWDGERSEKMAFMSPAFKEIGYGQMVSRELQQMAKDIETTLSCQPFMTRITRVEDREIQFASGASSGIRPGDKFQLYRTRPIFKGSQFQGTKLIAVKQVLQVSLVQPGFSAGKLTTDPTRLNIQEDDVLIRW